MPNLTIVFTGLILHYERINQNNVNHGKFAVVVDDRSTHVPIMRISKNAHIKDVDTWKGTDKGSHYEYDLVGRSVTIENLTAGAVTPDALFKKNVPSLKEMHGATDTLHTNIPDGKPQAGVAAYVAYSGGDVTVSACFEAEAVFDPALTGDPRCLARTLKFTGVTTTGDEITIVGNGDKVIVEKEVVIEISNSSNSGGTDHHKAFKKLLASSTELRDLVRTTRVCGNCVAQKTLFFELNGTATRIVLALFPALRPVFAAIGKVAGVFIVPRRRGPSVECSNSQWP